MTPIPTANNQSSRNHSRIPVRVHPQPADIGNIHPAKSTAATRISTPQICITPPTLMTNSLEVTKKANPPISKVPIPTSVTSTPTRGRPAAAPTSKPVSRVLFPEARAGISRTSSNNESSDSPLRVTPLTRQRGSSYLELTESLKAPRNLISPLPPGHWGHITGNTLPPGTNYVDPQIRKPPPPPRKPTQRLASEQQSLRPRPLRLPPLEPYRVPTLEYLSDINPELDNRAPVMISRRRSTEYVQAHTEQSKSLHVPPIVVTTEDMTVESAESKTTRRSRKRNRFQRAGDKLLKRWKNFAGLRPKSP